MIRHIILPAFLVAYLTSVASSHIVHVPGTAATIQAGLSAAASGDTVMVAAGIYEGEGNRDIDFLGKSVTIASSGGASVTVIDCSGVGRGFHFHSNEDSSAVVSGFTITDGFDYNYGGGIFCEMSSSPKIVDCIIADCNAVWRGGGVCTDDSSPVIAGTEVRGNTAIFGAGMSFNGSSIPVVRDCEIVGNEASSSGGGVGCSDDSHFTFRRSIVDSNYAESFGGGLDCDHSSPVLSDIAFTENVANSGGGVNCKYSSPELDRVTFRENRAYLHGAGLHAWFESSPVLTDCFFAGNVAAADGGGFYVSTNTVFDLPVFTGCRFEGNKAWGDGGAGRCWESFVTIDRCEFVGNEAVDSGAGLYCTNNAVSEITECFFDSNSAGDTGGAICAALASLTSVVNSTIVRNSADRGGGIFCGRHSTLHTEDSIIAFSQAGGAAACDGQGDYATFVQCCVSENVGGDGLCGTAMDIIREAPCFCGDSWRGDYELCSDSPCLPANNAWNTLIGAYGEGCEDCCGPVHEVSWGVIKAMYR